MNDNYRFLLTKTWTAMLVLPQLIWSGLNSPDMDHFLRGLKFRVSKTQTLENSDLENSDLENSYLENSDLENSYLENSYLENSYLENSDLENSYLENSDPLSWDKRA